MPPKKKVDLPDHVRAAVLADIALTHRNAVEAVERDKVRIYLATEQGLDTYELAAELGLSQSVISKYRIQGKQILERQEGGTRESAGDRQPGEDPVRSGELEPLG